MTSPDRLKLATTSVYLHRQGKAGQAIWATLLAKAIKIDAKEMIEARGGQSQFINPHDSYTNPQEIFPFSTVCFKTFLPDMTVYCIQTDEAELFYTAGGALPTYSEDFSHLLHEIAQDDGLGRLVLPSNSALSKDEFRREGTPVMVEHNLEMIPGESPRFRMMIDGQVTAAAQVVNNEVSRTYVTLAHRGRGLEHVLEHKVNQYIDAQIRQGMLKKPGPLNFWALYDPRIKDKDDLTHFLGGFDGVAFGSLNGLTVFRALQRIDMTNVVKSRLILNEFTYPIQHFAVGAVLCRTRELENPGIDERIMIDEVVKLMTTVYGKASAQPGVQKPLVAAGMLALLDFKKSTNIDYFADQIIGLPGGKKSLGWSLLSHKDISQGLGGKLSVDFQPTYAVIRTAIERQMDLKSWILKKMPPEARRIAFSNTGFQEIIATIPKADRGKTLEDALGL
jgi:hypothetical protein